MKALNTSLKHFIVQKARVSNKEAVQYILSGKVLVNGKKGKLNQVLLPEDAVHINQVLIKSPKAWIYLAYYKPRGIESTLNSQIPHNLLAALSFNQSVFPVGRLDKDSEGLMLLTNNGKIFDKIIDPENHQEKEYLVTVDKPLTPEALALLASGVVIMGKRTRPAIVNQVDATTFNIILTQGRNRQIRRMCYQLGYLVEKLVRIRMLSLELGNLRPGEWRHLSQQEINAINQGLSAGAGQNPLPGQGIGA
jgi:23S rRNA pseudouridine2604 synthase